MLISFHTGVVLTGRILAQIAIVRNATTVTNL